MNNIEKGKKNLKNLSVLSLVINIGAIAVGTLLMILGAIALGDAKIFQGLLELIIGIAFFALAVIALIIGAVTGSISSSMTATKGSVVEENLGHGTVNAILCGKCGQEIKTGDEFCANCGHPTSNTKKCACGVENDIDADFCNRCGANLK